MPTLTEQLYTWPAPVAALQQTIQALDACFLNGFVGIQGDTLESLPRLFAGTPLQARLTESVESITQNAFMEAHFVMLAAARSALQGTLYDVLRQHARTILGREAAIAQPAAIPIPVADPLLESVRHWLMEIAIAGFARLEAEAVLSFSSTLAQVRANPATAEQGTLLTAFWHEVLESLPIKDSADVPLTRWCDLWSVLMLKAMGTQSTPEPQPVSGTLYPLAMELRAFARAASLVMHGVLVSDTGPQLVRTTWNSFKVAAIENDEIWLLFPEAQMLMEALAQSKSLILEDMALLSSCDLVWNIDAARVDKKFKWRDITEAYFGLGKNALSDTAMNPLERHPIHIAEPVYLTDYRVEESALNWDDGTVLRLDPFRSFPESEAMAGVSALAGTSALFGFLRYDDGHWFIQALSADDGAKTFVFAGQNGAAILKKPPKTSTVSVLRERASRLLRKKVSS